VPHTIGLKVSLFIACWVKISQSEKITKIKRIIRAKRYEWEIKINSLNFEIDPAEKRNPRTKNHKKYLNFSFIYFSFQRII